MFRRTKTTNDGWLKIIKKFIKKKQKIGIRKDWKNKNLINFIFYYSFN